MDTVSRSEQVESDLDRLITKRYDRRASEEQQRVEDLWAESVRRHHARRQRELALQWLEYHQRRQRAHRKTFALLDTHHEAEIAKYEAMLGLDGPEHNGHKESA